MKTEIWIIETRESSGRLLAETHIEWQPGKGIINESTRLLVPDSLWERIKRELSSRLGGLT